jgi:glycosyltransferase involved in cell wall biosynthesis
MRVLLACDWHLKYSAALAMALRRSGADVAFLCRTHSLEFGESPEELQRLLEAVQESGAELLLLPGRVSSARSLPDLVGAFRQVRRWRPQIVHVQENWDPRLLALARRYRLVVTVHDPALHPGEANVARWEEAVWRGWLRAADRVVVHGERLRELVPRSVARDRIAVIPHGMEPHREPVPPPLDRTILLYGRLAKYKGLDVLLEAMEIVWRERSDVRLLVYGKGPEAERLPDDPRIEASIGYVPEAMEDWMFARASLVVLPYIGGSQSGVGVRSLARGIPTVVTDVGSLPELALDESFLVPARDPQRLATALLRHLDHGPELRSAVLRFARSRFSWDVVSSLSLELYEDVLREASNQR